MFDAKILKSIENIAIFFTNHALWLDF